MFLIVYILATRAWISTINVTNTTASAFAIRPAVGRRTIVYSIGRNEFPITMTIEDANPSSTYTKLLGETAKIDWQDLERFFAQGKLLSVASDLDLVSVAEAIANDDSAVVMQWLSSGLVERMPAETAADYAARKPELWAVVVSPWVCVQERT